MQQIGMAGNRQRWQGFAIGALVVAAVVALAGTVAPQPVGFFDRTSNAPADTELSTYLAEVGEHDRLIRETLALELAVGPTAMVNPSAGVASAVAGPESYIAEHERLIDATLGDEFQPVTTTVAPATTESYIQEHERLLEATLGTEWRAGASPTPATVTDSASPTAETYVEEHARLLAGMGIVVPGAE